MQHTEMDRGKMHGMHGAISDAMSHVNYKIAIISGKGGVGKTSVVVNLAAALKIRGMEVGIFDADVHGPASPRWWESIPRCGISCMVATGLIRSPLPMV